MRPADGTPLYVHLPYCAAKCHYCDFYSLAVEGPDLEGLVAGLLAEAERRAPREPRTVFLGGGTPSLLPEALLERLLSGLDRVTGFRGSAAEVTVECNPESLDEAKAACLLAGGATRLSIGLQSLRPRALELFGRPHGVAAGLEAFAAARAAGAGRVGVDLIYAWPGQTAEEWKVDLERILALAPDHLSAYGLAWEEGTSFERWLRSGRLERLPEERELALFWLTRDTLEARGYFPYEISNFSPNGQECRHNQNYWRNGDYVGLGPSAVSKVGFERSGNPRSVARWSRALADAQDPREWSETLAPLGRLGETWWLGLRTREGVDPTEARRTAGHAAEPDPLVPVADAWVRSGHLERAGTRLRLTRLGLPLADAVAASFLAEPEPLPEPAGTGA